MPEVAKIGSILKTGFSRMVRGLLLVLWILGLTLVALGSLRGSLTDLLLLGSLINTDEVNIYAIRERRKDSETRIRLPGFESVFSERIWMLGQGPEKGPEKGQRCPTGDQLLSEFRIRQPNLPPVDAVLDVILPKWHGVIINTPDGNCTIEQVRTNSEAYQYLFSKVAERLRSLARNDGVDSKALIIDATVLPREFQQFAAESVSTDPKSPLEVQDWVIRERARIKKETQARALVSTFLLLSVLGAFGALIFLIRDYITLDEEKTLSDYIFRPILGIFLAMAMFIVDILTHSVVSTASILEIRYEPLYLLAFGAGLLSETAYEAIRLRADSAFKRKDAGEKEKVEPTTSSSSAIGDTEVTASIQERGGIAASNGVAAAGDTDAGSRE